MIICIDFDGTIVDDAYPQVGKLKEGAKDVINNLVNSGHYVIIWTCRTGELMLNAINFLLTEGICFDQVNNHCPDNVFKYGPGGKKVYADVYIDDKNLGGFPGWDVVEKTIIAMQGAPIEPGMFT